MKAEISDKRKPAMRAGQIWRNTITGKPSLLVQDMGNLMWVSVSNFVIFGGAKNDVNWEYIGDLTVED